MIKIIEDTSKIINDDKYIYLNEYSEYARIYEDIQKAVKDRKHISVVVRKPAIMVWFERLKSRYEENIVEIERVTYKTHLQSLWEILIPEKYSPDDLEALNLINLDVYPKHNENFEDFILSYFFDPVFSNHSFTSGLVVQLLKSYDNQKWGENFKSILLFNIYNERIAKWQSKIKEDYLLSILKSILVDPEKLTTELMLYKILRTKIYHEIGKLVFRERFEHLQRLGINLKRIEIDYSKINQTIKQIEIYLNALNTPTNQSELEALIASYSGLVPAEYDHIEKILEGNPLLISNTVVNQLKSVFVPIYSKIGKRIDRLNDLIVPEKPGYIEIDSEIDDVKKWLVHKYLPYQNWLLRSNVYQEDFIRIGDSFSAWLYHNWEDIKTNSLALVSNWLYRNASVFDNKDKINIVLIVDNLCFFHSKLIEDLFADNDIHLISSEPYLSMIPSETETSKKCLLAGKSNYNEIDQRSYTDILNKGWIPYFNSANFIYIPNLDQFEKITIKKGNSYFVNYHSIDIALHQDQAKLGLTHDKQVLNLLTELVNRVVKILEKINIIEQTTVHIISDHGSTRFHPSTKNNLDVHSFKKKTTNKITDRYIILSNEEFSNLPDNLRHDCFFIEKNRFGLTNNFLCAREGNTFKEYSFNSYLHGGLLPEEVVVPHLVFEKVKVNVEQPILNLLRNKFRYKSEEIELQIENPNSFPLENIQIKILNSNVECLPKIIDWMKSKTREVTKFQARFKKSVNQDESHSLKFSISFIANKIQVEYENKIDISMVSMVELKDTTVFDL